MDDFLNDVGALAEIAARRKAPAFDAHAIMRSVGGAVPLPPARSGEFGGKGLLAAASAVAAAACVLVAAHAFSAWADLSNPFLAMDAYLNPIEWLK